MFVLVLATFLVSANAFILPSVPMLDGKIVGGTLATITEAPYQVALLMNGGSGSFGQVCGGSIVTRNVIVTAGHCTKGTSPSQWKIRAGSAFHNNGGQVVAVSQIIVHSGFTNNLDNDISLMKMSTSLTLSSSVAVVRLPSQGQTIADGANAFVTGWGTLFEGGSSPTQLYKVTIPIVNQQQCVNAYAGFNTVTANMICAGRIASGGADACQGDSGGPLIVSGSLIGITSWGRGCAQAGYPGVWTRVPNYVNWINSNI